MLVLHVNYWAVLVAAIINMIIGGIWYSPRVFGKTWLELIGKRMEDMRSSARRAYGQAFIVALVVAWVLARFITLVGATTLGRGAVIGFEAWLGFVATTSAGGVIFAGQPPKLYLINNGYQVVTLIIMGALLAVWR